MKVASIHTWKIRPGRYADFLGTLAEGQKIIERLGGSFRTWVPLIGGDPTQLTVVIEHYDICPKYDEPVLPDEDGRCSLCGQHDVR